MDLPKGIRIANTALAFGVLALILLLARHYANMALDDVASSAFSETSEELVLTVPKSKPPRDLLSYSAILETNPFGKSSAGPLTAIGSTKKNSQNGQESGDVAVSLTLVGTIAGEGNYGFGIFEDQKQQQSVFRVGTQIPGYGMLIRVTPDFVVLSTPQGEEHIKITNVAEIIDNRSTTISKQRKRTKTSYRGKRSSKDVGFIRRTGKQKFVLDKEGVQESLKNPQRILTDARMLPNIVNNKQEGFRVSEVKPNGVYGKLGLKNGDVLLKINDLELNSPDSGIQAFSTLKGMDQIKLFLIRDEKRIALTYQIR